MLMTETVNIKSSRNMGNGETETTETLLLYIDKVVCVFVLNKLLMSVLVCRYKCLDVCLCWC